MNQVRPVFLSLLLLMAFCVACQRSQSNNDVPDNVLNEGKFRQVLIDVLIADAYIQELPMVQDSQKMLLNKTYAQIFDRHNVTKDEYLKTLSYYNTHPEDFNALLEPVKDSLSTLEAGSH
jgi:hypothetical protein